MQAPSTNTSTAADVQPDALLVERIAALADKSALAELDARHGMTLYAIAYSLLFDPGAADAAVAAAFREVWRWAASFSACTGSVRQWLGDLTRNAAARARSAEGLGSYLPSGNSNRDLSTSRLAAAVVPTPTPMLHSKSSPSLRSRLG